MSCYNPLKGWLSNVRNSSGKRSVVFKKIDGLIDKPVTIPCGVCLGCRIARSREWAVRCVHEASLHDCNSFITLTFNSKSLDKNLSLDKRDFQLFMKRLRKAIHPKKVRFFHCGEYGCQNGRPHHHACLFGYDFPDKILWQVRNGVRLYLSSMLDELWSDPKTGESYGFSTIGDVTFESAAYIARYVVKKIIGKELENRDPDCGVVPEYITMSRRPGIAHDWIETNMKSTYSDDKLPIKDRNGKIFVMKPLKYYDSIYDLTDHDNMNKLKGIRKLRAKKYHEKNGTPERLFASRKIKEQQLSNLRRPYENENVYGV